VENYSLVSALGVLHRQEMPLALCPELLTRYVSVAFPQGEARAEGQAHRTVGREPAQASERKMKHIPPRRRSRAADSSRRTFDELCSLFGRGAPAPPRWSAPVVAIESYYENLKVESEKVPEDASSFVSPFLSPMPFLVHSRCPAVRRLPTTVVSRPLFRSHRSSRSPPVASLLDPARAPGESLWDLWFLRESDVPHARPDGPDSKQVPSTQPFRSVLALLLVEALTVNPSETHGTHETLWRLSGSRSL
jgi:hypothetical protein